MKKRIPGKSNDSRSWRRTYAMTTCHTFIGSWQFASTSFIHRLHANARNYLAAKDVDQASVAEILESLRGDVEAMVDTGVFTFNADNTFTYDDAGDDLNDHGTWHVLGDRLTIREQDESVTVRYRATDTRLTWILPRSDVTRMRAAIDAQDPEMGMILSMGISTYAFFYTRA